MTDLNRKLESQSDLLQKLQSSILDLTEAQKSMSAKLDRFQHADHQSMAIKDDSGKPMTIAIQKKSSVKAETRSQVSHVRCLLDLGFPVSTTTEQVRIL
jgi:septal ring factor EnvC (AmiA/AmiB activator)